MRTPQATALQAANDVTRGDVPSVDLRLRVVLAGIHELGMRAHGGEGSQPTFTWAVVLGARGFSHERPHARMHLDDGDWSAGKRGTRGADLRTTRDNDASALACGQVGSTWSLRRDTLPPGRRHPAPRSATRWRRS